MCGWNTIPNDSTIDIPNHMPGLEIPDRIFPELLFSHAPAWLTGLVLAGATAAAMSTLDSILHANMTVLTRDVYQRYIVRSASQRHYINAGRIVVLGLLFTGYVLSVSSSQLLVVLVALSGAGALQLMPAILGVCFPTRRPLTRSGILAGISAGLTALFITLIVVPHPLGLHGGVWSLLANTCVTVVVSRATKPPSAQTVERIHGLMDRFAESGDAAIA